MPSKEPIGHHGRFGGSQADMWRIGEDSVMPQRIEYKKFAR